MILATCTYNFFLGAERLAQQQVLQQGKVNLRAANELNLRTQHLDLALQQLLMACSCCPPNPAPAWERLPPAAVRDMVLLWKIRLGSKCFYELPPAVNPAHSKVPCAAAHLVPELLHVI